MKVIPIALSDGNTVLVRLGFSPTVEQLVAFQDFYELLRKRKRGPEKQDEIQVQDQALRPPERGD